jgi:hypothetical protein
MGHTHSTVVIVRVLKSDISAASTKSEQEIVVPLAVVTDSLTGAAYFDLCLFDHLAKIAETKHGSKVNNNLLNLSSAVCLRAALVLSWCPNLK